MAFRSLWWLALVVVVGALACSSPAEETESPDALVEAADEADVTGPEGSALEVRDDEVGASGEAVGNDDDVAAPSKCAYTGRVLDEGGAPIEKAAVVVCGEDALLCVKANTKADGTFTVGGAARAQLGVKVLGARSGHTSLTLPQSPCDRPETDLGDIVLSSPAAGQVIEAALGGGAQAHPDLWLDLPADLAFPNYEEAVAVQAALIDLDTLHPALAAQLEAPIAAFAIVPYDTEVATPVPFEAQLPVASTTVGVYVLDYLTGHFLPFAEVPVEADGRVHLSAENGLPQMTWVAFVAL
jgi:hypothetical protein